MTLRPKSIGFDRCGTATCFSRHRMVCDLCEGRLPPERMHLFGKDPDDPRFGVVMGGCKPYGQVLQPAWRRACKRRGLATAGGPGRAASRRGAPHTMPPAIRKTAVLTKHPRVIEAYTRSPGAPMPLPPLGENHGR